jgi:hypothetical protein
VDVNPILQRGVQGASESIIAFVTAVAGVGTLSMALIQAVKDMFPIRRLFHRSRMRRWLRGLGSGGPLPGIDYLEISARPPSYDDAEHELITLATAGNSAAFYDLPIEQLCGQMNAAVAVALDYPHRYPGLVSCLGALADPRDVGLAFAPPPAARGSREMLSPNEAAAVDAFVDARNRLNHVVQRAIDGFQIATGFQWKWLLQLVSIILSGAIATTAYGLYGASRGFWQGAGVFFVTGVLGGFLAPVARDLVAALQSLRGRR